MLEPMPDLHSRKIPGAVRGERLDRELARVLSAVGIRRARVLVAVSGGRDSCVLLDLLRGCAEAFELELVVAHVHHGLRGADADADAGHVAGLARTAALAFHERRIDPESARRSGPSRVRPSLEEAARDLRRAALAALADETGCAFIATAHHAGDQAETVLLRLLRGTGPDGLAGMAPRSDDGRWLKPLLGITPAAIDGWAKARGLLWREDASNTDRRFARNRVRLDLLPELEARFNPQLLRALVDLAEAVREDRAWIESQVERAAGSRIEWCDPVVRFELEGWGELPDALARRVVRRAMVRAGLGREVSRVQLMRVLAFLRRGRTVGRDKMIELPGGFLLRRVADHFELSATPPTSR